MRNKKIITALVTGILCIGSCVPAFAGTWEHSKYGDEWKYIKDDGTYAKHNEWICDNGKQYYFYNDSYSYDISHGFGDSGIMATYNHKCNGVYYCFNPDGSLCSGGWNRSKGFGHLFCFTDKNGKTVTDRMFMVDDVIYFPRNERGEICTVSDDKPYRINFFNGYEKKLYGYSKYGYLMNSKVVNKDGSPYPIDGELLKGETIPVYSSDGTYIKTIQN